MNKAIPFAIIGLIVILIVILFSITKKEKPKPKPVTSASLYKDCNSDNYDFCKDWQNVSSAYRKCVNGKFLDATYPYAENNPQQDECTVTCTSDEFFVDTFRNKCRKPKVNYSGKYIFQSKLVEFPEPTAPQSIDVKILYEDESGEKAFGLIIINNLTFTFTTRPYTDNDNYTFTFFFNNDTAFMKIKSPTDIELTTSYGIYKRE